LFSGEMMGYDDLPKTKKMYTFTLTFML